LVEATNRVIEAETNTSTGTKARLWRRVQQFLEDTYGPGEVPLPSQSTFYRLAGTLAAGRHTFGSAATRRSLANRPAGSFTATVAARPGGQIQIDSAPLDVMAVFGDGLVGRPELTIAVDVTTRTICAAVLRPERTKAVDAALLLARMVVPEPMRPGWDSRLAFEASVLPHEQLKRIDARFAAAAAAKPVIIPDSITIDHGKVFVSETFMRACDRLGVSLQLAHPGTPTDKGIVERTFASINTLFCQHVAGYTGRDVTRRGADVAAEAVWSLPELAELFEEWVVTGWQTRPHDSLRDPRVPSQALTPNTMFANMVAAAGYLPLPLTGEDYIELLPVLWRTINDYGIRIEHRTYDSPDFAGYRRQPSGNTAKRGLWEVHYEPHDLTCVWIRGRSGTWIHADWTHRHMISLPFGDLSWRQARKCPQTGCRERPR
jgi:transposase InsO family protein